MDHQRPDLLARQVALPARHRSAPARDLAVDPRTHLVATEGKSHGRAHPAPGARFDLALGRQRTQLADLVASVDVVITTGGTGISRRDGSYEVISQLLDKRLDGFGELFRALSFEEIGPSAMLSRACAGTARGKILISLPGSQNAVRLGMTRLVLPELGHLVREVTR